MPFQRIMAMQITDHEGYAAYREHMTPILAEYGGRFDYDFVISEVLKKCCDVEINRVFMIVFPSKQHSLAFFSDPRYKAVRKQYFENSVGSVTQIAEFEGE
jgi:uncharacterized protein (DUF1330 family)